MSPEALASSAPTSPTALIGAGHRVLIVDDLSSGRKENVPEGAELHELDIRSAAAADLMAEAGIEVLVHHAAQIDVRRSVADPRLDADVNIGGTLNLLEAGRRGALREVVFASTGGAIYGEQDYFPADEHHPTRPLSPYGVAKLAVERYLYFYHAVHGLDVTCLRYANVYGPRQSPHGEAGVVAIFLDRLPRGPGGRDQRRRSCRPATTSTSATSSPRTSPPSASPASTSSTSAPASRPRSSSCTRRSTRSSARARRLGTPRPNRASSGAP